MRKYLATIALLFFCSACIYLFAQSKKEKREYYQITVYHFKKTAQQVETDHYLENALLPALHRSGFVHIGIFTPLANDTAADKKIYLIIPAGSAQVVIDLTGKLLKDKTFQEAGKNYI